ncbi:polyferredoxin [Sphingomonas sp. BE138]|uniref:hypothetical protein n=1 Tax=Sphingomonas sp. BE138 TaxID=2817845 RepID=UPI00286042F1|nr:hypothetical protein [Sphingomonas sp. BE138]MDR6790453.1 polyferredoxin [Sphingomonas sp. BE138]
MQTFDNLDVRSRSSHSDAMADRLPALRNWLFWLALIAWLAIAIPIGLFSLLTLELPLWPSFSVESTLEGIAIWAILAAWFYITPVVLIGVRRRR